MGKFSRDKGKRFERQMAKVFGEWLGVECRPTPQSGAIGGDWNMGGDLMFMEPVNLHVECKHVEGWNFDQLMQPEPTGLVPQWWEKAKAECGGRDVFLVMKRNRSPVWICHTVSVLYHEPFMETKLFNVNLLENVLTDEVLPYVKN